MNSALPKENIPLFLIGSAGSLRLRAQRQTEPAVIRRIIAYKQIQHIWGRQGASLLSSAGGDPRVLKEPSGDPETTKCCLLFDPFFAILKPQKIFCREFFAEAEK